MLFDYKPKDTSSKSPQKLKKGQMDRFIKNLHEKIDKTNLRNHARTTEDSSNSRQGQVTTFNQATIRSKIMRTRLNKPIPIPNQYNTAKPIVEYIESFIRDNCGL